MGRKKGEGKDEALEEGLGTEAETHTQKSGKPQYAKPRCPNCGSSQIHVRIRSDEIVCHYCGEITSPTRPHKKRRDSMSLLRGDNIS